MGPKKTPVGRPRKTTKKALTTGQSRKMVTRSVTIRVNMEESFLKPSTSNTEIVTSKSPPVTAPSHLAPTDNVLEAIMQSLGELSDQNKVITNRITSLEQGASQQRQSTPLTQQTVTATSSGWQQHASSTNLPPNSHLVQPTSHSVDANPSLQTLRQHQPSEEAANYSWRQLEGQLQQQMDGKILNNTSGRFNVKRIVTALPQYRWPNEGVPADTKRRKVAYDDLSISQWVAGQASNILLTRDYETQMRMLNQLILTMQDTITMPSSVTRIEDRRLRGTTLRNGHSTG